MPLRAPRSHVLVSLALALVACGDSAGPGAHDVSPSDTMAPDAATVDSDDVATVLDADTEFEADAETDDSGPAGARLRLVTLNLRCLIDDWAARLPVIVDGLAALDPDVLGLQEVCQEAGGADALSELMAALEARTGRRYALHRSVTHRAWEKYDEGLAIASALPLSDPSVSQLPTGVFPRKLLLVRLALEGGASLVFGTTHLDHQSDLTRKRQADAVAGAIAAYARADEARVVTGDLNEGPSGGVHQSLAGAGFVDLWQALHPDDPGLTFPASNPSERIDYVWLDAAGSGLAGASVERILVPAAGAVAGSDHLGLTAVLAE